MRFGRRRGEVIGDEPGNTNKDPNASEKAVPKGEGRAELPLLFALRQDVPGGHSGPRLCIGEVQSGRARCRWADLLGNRDVGAGGAAGRHQEGASRKDVPTTGGATGHEPEARWWREAARDSDYPGPGGADSSQAVTGTNLGSGLRSE